MELRYQTANGSWSVIQGGEGKPVSFLADEARGVAFHLLAEGIAVGVMLVLDDDSVYEEWLMHPFRKQPVRVAVFA